MAAPSSRTARPAIQSTPVRHTAVRPADRVPSRAQPGRHAAHDLTSTPMLVCCTSPLFRPPSRPPRTSQPLSPLGLLSPICMHWLLSLRQQHTRRGMSYMRSSRGVLQVVRGVLPRQIVRGVWGRDRTRFDLGISRATRSVNGSIASSGHCRGQVNAQSVTRSGLGRD